MTFQKLVGVIVPIETFGTMGIHGLKLLPIDSAYIIYYKIKKNTFVWLIRRVGDVKISDTTKILVTDVETAQKIHG